MTLGRIEHAMDKCEFVRDCRGSEKLVHIARFVRPRPCCRRFHDRVVRSILNIGGNRSAFELLRVVRDVDFNDAPCRFLIDGKPPDKPRPFTLALGEKTIFAEREIFQLIFGIAIERNRPFHEISRKQDETEVRRVSGARERKRHRRAIREIEGNVGSRIVRNGQDRSANVVPELATKRILAGFEPHYDQLRGRNDNRVEPHGTLITENGKSRPVPRRPNQRYRRTNGSVDGNRFEHDIGNAVGFHRFLTYACRKVVDDDMDDRASERKGSEESVGTARARTDRDVVREGQKDAFDSQSVPVHDPPADDARRLAAFDG